MLALKLIKEALKSFKDCSNKTIKTKNESYSIVKNNSPYISRRKCEIGFSGTGIDSSLILENSKHVITVSIIEERIKGNVIQKYMPRFYILNCIPELLRDLMPEWIFKHRFLVVSIINRFIDYDENGKAIFNNKKAIWNDTEDNIFLEFKSEEEKSIDEIKYYICSLNETILYEDFSTALEKYEEMKQLNIHPMVSLRKKENGIIYIYKYDVLNNPVWEETNSLKVEY